jgi:hypothetical protein
MSDNMQWGMDSIAKCHSDRRWVTSSWHGVTQSRKQRMDVTEYRCHRKQVPKIGRMSQKVGANENTCHRRHVPLKTDVTEITVSKKIGATENTCHRR